MFLRRSAPIKKTILLKLFIQLMIPLLIYTILSEITPVDIYKISRDHIKLKSLVDVYLVRRMM